MQHVLGFREKGGKSWEIHVRHDLKGFKLAYFDARGLIVKAKETPTTPSAEWLDLEAGDETLEHRADIRAGQATAEG
jgi:hypothetical protein